MSCKRFFQINAFHFRSSCKKEIAYKEYFCNIIINLYIGFENVKMEGGGQQTTVSFPLFAV